jgi:TonB-dependent starch-binding outer membrane protein SusC
MQILANLKYIPLLVLTIIVPSGILSAQEININDADSVKLRQQITDTNIIDKEVATGYTVHRIRDITGSVSIVEPAGLTALPAGNVSNLLQGRASGVTVTGSGRPGETSKVRIRGFSSFLNNDPLYVVDGVPTQDLSSINPYDVASVSVLKDAGAASIYGSRASNGVIIITTKIGDKGFNVTYNMSMGIQNPGKGTVGDVLDTKEYANLQWLVYKNDQAVETHPTYGYSTNPTPSIPAWAGNTDWYDAITDASGIQNHNLSISGGGENAKFYAGFGAFRQNGIIIYTDNTRYNGQLNSKFRFFNGRLKAGENINVTSHSYLSVPNLNEGNPILTGPYRSQSIIPVIITQPITGMTHDFVPGEWGGTGIANRLGNSGNAVADLTRRKDDRSRDTYMTGSIYMDIMIMDGLNFRSTMGGTTDKGFTTNNTYATYERSENIGATSREKSRFNSSDWVWTNTVTLDKQFGQHKILAVTGYEAVNYGIGQTRSTLDTIRYTPTRLLSTFVSANYAFRDKYLLSATLRRDGCSRFSESQRYGIFPSFSAGWRIGEESFLDGLKWISDLKIRASWGKTGNQFALSPQNAVFLFGSLIGGSYYDLYGTFNSSVRGYYPLRIGNPDATWETNTTTDIGFDARLFDSRISIVSDWYSKKADDVLYNPPLPGTAGTGEAPYVNVASMKNSGIEIELSYQNRWNNLGLNASVIFTTYNNQIKSIADGVEYFGSGDSRIGYLVRNEAGHPLSSFYGYQVVGIFKNQIEVENAPKQESAQPGLLRFENQDTLTNEYWLSTQERYKRKTFIDNRDKTYIGNPNPDFTYGINLALSWKNFDISGFFYGSQGNDIFNYNKWWTDFWPSFQGQKSKDLLYNSWTEKNTGATVPKASNQSNFSTNNQVCSYYIEDGSYLRLKNLQVGYTFPKNMMEKIKIKSLRVYLQAVNLFTLTKYSGLDPEIGGGDLAFGIDYGNYPNAKQFIFGLSLTL